MAESSLPELVRWLAEGQRFFQMCLETLEGLRARSETLESENVMLREEVTRLRHRVEIVETERAEMIAAINDLAGHVTQAVDHILQKSEDGEATQ
jgi:regulator of replication initiation timing